ncbi:4-hydroxy-tetrahydrodipicolinate synthase [Tistlia consotensis]|uniref:4-hydroxy-tetrahydrodipicolinate synthase n=1 Tax=Tistlia consotensis USBA 355 TaxID=560819 RepID=A0A1Y6BD26_9PROT|nr:4-hydroxy-tetrahydrodipicolinate synthase [Tistlia consotensis]SMF05228.1 4-hydroxy-tetrahydrodipicolinate synthase [Tistlia consotensis USBA 355]SNR55140.1 4-hydroxy-tetrahydrodipicolinate synthase [Tistlia consotensis]
MREIDENHRAIAGLWLPLVTPFRDGALDEASLARLVRHYCEQPVEGLILAATTGEALTLDAGETERLVAAAAAARTRALPLFLGLSGSDTRRLAAKLEATEAWPVEGYLIPAPYYVRPSQEGLRRHFEALAGATDRPILLYNIPYRTGVAIENETLLALAELPNIAGLKDCCRDPQLSFDLLCRRPAGFSVLTGEDALFHGALCQGADGGILAAAHAETRLFAAVRQALLAGDRAGALARWRPLFELARLLFAEPSPAAVKHWLWRTGLIDSPEVRLPMTGVSPALAGRLDAEIVRRGTLAAAYQRLPSLPRGAERGA